MISEIYEIFKPKVERANDHNNFTPVFYRFIGVENQNKYNDIIKILNDKIKQNKDNTIFFEQTIPLSPEVELIQSIYNELNTMNINNIQNEDITIFDNKNINDTFLFALDYVIKLYSYNEKNTSKNIKYNFITKIIVWAYTFIKEIKFDKETNQRCIYYGEIQKHEVYFLILLYAMEFDIIYINPIKDSYFDEIDIENISTKYQYMGICQMETFIKKAENANSTEIVETMTRQIEKEVEKELFTSTGMYKPWQFRDGYTKCVLIDSIVEDIYIYFREVAKMREGFLVDDKLVYVPCFFYKIDGQFIDEDEYQRLVKYCMESELTLFFNNNNIINKNININDVYSLMFCQLNDMTFDIEEIKKLPIYKFSKYSEQTQNFILNKYNETITSDIFNEKMNKEDILRLLLNILSMDEKYIRLVDNFDFTSYVPKIVIYLNKEESLDDDTTRFIKYLHIMGMDVIIFNPSGLFNINNVINDTSVRIIRLDKINYNSEYKDLTKYKKSIFNKFFN